ncbi:MAG: F0F1 ATP synthase subunit gamma [Eubacteriales bacterium]|nr:F0F1 ATP synthase subunit gamma [Eubacteriales bacterium]
MSDSMAGMRRKIKSAGDLKSVVRTMKAMASSSIGQYERSVIALAEYYSTIELGLGLCLRMIGSEPLLEIATKQKSTRTTGVVVFGSDQGMVGRFNDVIADYATARLAALPGKKHIWAVGERVYNSLTDTGFSPVGLYSVPYAIKGVTPLVGQLLVDCETSQSQGEIDEIRLFYNRPSAKTVYEPVSQRLLPLDENWRLEMSEIPWPDGNLPEVVGNSFVTLSALIHEYLFVSLFRACTESLASENASRLAAMQRADKNIDELLNELKNKYHRMRQSSIDSELFDVISGAEAMREKSRY